MRLRILMILLGWSLVIWNNQLAEQDLIIADPAMAGLASKEMKSALRYHGILSVQYDYEKNEYGFYRDGRWCRLMNDYLRLAIEDRKSTTENNEG